MGVYDYMHFHLSGSITLTCIFVCIVYQRRILATNVCLLILVCNI